MVDLDSLLETKEHSISVGYARKGYVHTKWGTKYEISGLGIYSLPSPGARHGYQDLFTCHDRKGQIGRIAPANNLRGSILISEYAPDLVYGKDKNLMGGTRPENRKQKKIAQYEIDQGEYRVSAYKRGVEPEWQVALPLDYLLQKVHQFSFKILGKTMLKEIKKVGPCSAKDFLKNPPFEEVPWGRLVGTLSLLSMYGHIKWIEGERKNQILLAPRTYREKRRSLQ